MRIGPRVFLAAIIIVIDDAEANMPVVGAGAIGEKRGRQRPVERRALIRRIRVVVARRIDFKNVQIVSTLVVLKRRFKANVAIGRVDLRPNASRLNAENVALVCAREAEAFGAAGWIRAVKAERVRSALVALEAGDILLQTAIEAKGAHGACFLLTRHVHWPVGEHVQESSRQVSGAVPAVLQAHGSQFGKLK